MKERHDLKRPLYVGVDNEEISRYNLWRDRIPQKVYYTSNRAYDYLNYIYQITENIFGYVQLRGERTGESFKV